MFQLRNIRWVCEFLGAFVRLQTKLLTASGLSVCLSLRQSQRNNTILNGQIFKQFDIRVFFLKSVESFKVPLKCGKSNEKFT